MKKFLIRLGFFILFSFVLVEVYHFVQLNLLQEIAQFSVDQTTDNDNYYSVQNNMDGIRTAINIVFYIFWFFIGYRTFKYLKK